MSSYIFSSSCYPTVLSGEGESGGSRVVPLPRWGGDPGPRCSQSSKTAHTELLPNEIRNNRSSWTLTGWWRHLSVSPSSWCVACTEHPYALFTWHFILLFWLAPVSTLIDSHSTAPLCATISLDVSVKHAWANGNQIVGKVHDPPRAHWSSTELNSAMISE